MARRVRRRVSILGRKPVPAGLREYQPPLTHWTVEQCRRYFDLPGPGDVTPNKKELRGWVDLTPPTGPTEFSLIGVKCPYDGVPDPDDEMTEEWYEDIQTYFSWRRALALSERRGGPLEW